MDAFAGFDPQVGEIRALRSYRVGPGGVLYPLFSARAWSDGENVAQCSLPRPASGELDPHLVPEPECTCGFYAYGSEDAALEYPHARYVLAVISCWGRVVAGTRGVRVERARIEAVWTSENVPPELVDQLRLRYPTTATYSDRALMLAEHPPTVLDCYELAPSAERRRNGLVLKLAMVAGLVMGVLPSHLITGNPYAIGVWAAELAFFIVGGVLLGRRKRDMIAARRSVLFGALALWMLSAFAGTAGTLLLRLPLFQLTVLTFAQRRALDRAARRFPAPIEDSER